MTEETLGKCIFIAACILFVPAFYFLVKGKLNKARPIEPKK
jgi:hypothetical protein